MLSSNRFGAGKPRLACLGHAGGLKRKSESQRVSGSSTLGAFFKIVIIFSRVCPPLPVRYLFPPLEIALEK